MPAYSSRCQEEEKGGGGGAAQPDTAFCTKAGPCSTVISVIILVRGAGLVSLWLTAKRQKSTWQGGSDCLEREPSKPSPTASAAAASIRSLMPPWMASFSTARDVCWLHLTGSTCVQSLCLSVMTEVCRLVGTVSIMSSGGCGQIAATAVRVR